MDTTWFRTWLRGIVADTSQIQPFLDLGKNVAGVIIVLGFIWGVLVLIYGLASGAAGQRSGGDGMVANGRRNAFTGAGIILSMIVIIPLLIVIVLIVDSAF